MDEPTAAADITRLIYRSRSKISEATFAQELGTILLAARRNNKAKGVTGALMYYEGKFAQALEGPNAAVHEIFARIKADDRHDAIEIKAEDKVQDRVFSRWAMASVGEHGDPDTPLLAHRDGVAAAEAWKTTPDQEAVLTTLRDATRGYGRGG